MFEFNFINQEYVLNCCDKIDHAKIKNPVFSLFNKHNSIISFYKKDTHFYRPIFFKDSIINVDNYEKFLKLRFEDLNKSKNIEIKLNNSIFTDSYFENININNFILTIENSFMRNLGNKWKNNKKNIESNYLFINDILHYRFKNLFIHKIYKNTIGFDSFRQCKNWFDVSKDYNFEVKK